MRRCKRGRPWRSEARRFGCLSREAWPEAEPLGCVSPSGKSRRGTPEGVRVLNRTRAAARKAAVVTEQRLTAFRFLFSFRSFFVARMERSEIRGGIEAYRSFPDFASLHPGYGRGA